MKMTLYLVRVSLNGIQDSDKGMKTLNAMQAVGGREVQPDLAPVDLFYSYKWRGPHRKNISVRWGCQSEHNRRTKLSGIIKIYIYIYIYIYICSDVSSPGSLFIYLLIHFVCYSCHTVNISYFTKQDYLVCLYTGGADCCLWGGTVDLFYVT